MRTTEHDRELAMQAAAGDQDAFAQLVQAYQKPIYNLTLRMSGNSEDAYDLTQEAFLRAWKSLAFFKGEAAFSTWLYRLASNVCIDFLRKKKRRNSEVSLQFVGDDGEPAELPLPDPTPGPEEQTLRTEDHRAVQQALNGLPPEYRMALSLHVLNGMSYEQIAEALDIKVGTVKSRIARGREKMRQALLQDGNISGGDSSDQTEGGEDA